MPSTTAWLVNAARAAGGRVVAVGTTAVRALESAADADGVVRPAAGWTDLVVTPRRGVRVVDGLLTGLHQPEAWLPDAELGRRGGRGQSEVRRNDRGQHTDHRGQRHHQAEEGLVGDDGGVPAHQGPQLRTQLCGFGGRICWGGGMWTDCAATASMSAAYSW
ncbi:S-adenosylmethionine:tRNA ribosyltransferase-isomerase [Streptomyces microflavus]